MRFAIATFKSGEDEDSLLYRIKRFLPSNYDAVITNDGVLIAGNDSAGWTLDGYVIPRLASGMIFAKETSRPQMWAAGWNMPGYLPETDPETFSEWKDARGYLVETIERFWDQDQDGHNICVPGGCFADCPDPRWLPIHTQLPLATPDQAWTHLNGDSSLVFWIVEASNDVFNIAGDGA